MVITRLGVCGPIAAGSGFTPKGVETSSAYDFITLGIGTPGGVAAYILVGLSRAPGVSLDLGETAVVSLVPLRTVRSLTTSRTAVSLMTLRRAVSLPNEGN